MSHRALLRLMRGDGGHGSLLAEERYWDAVVLGQPMSPDTIDPIMAATIQRVHAIDDSPLPDPAFAARLERDLIWRALNTHPERSAPATFTRSSSRAIAPSGSPTPIRRRVALDVIAAAALVAIMLASVVITLLVGPLASPSRIEAPLVLGPGMTNERIMLQARFDSFPDGILGAVVNRWVLQPGAAISMGDQESGAEGPAAYLVESGTLFVAPDGPIAVTRAGTTMPVSVSATSQVELLPGDQGYAPSGVTCLWWNDGDVPIRILEAKIMKGDERVQAEGILNYTVVSDYPFTKPDHPFTLTVFQATLQPGADLSANSIPGLEMLKVEAGRLVAIDVDGEGDPLPPVELGQATRSLRSFPPGRVYRSGNDEPVVLLLVTIADANPLSAGR